MGCIVIQNVRPTPPKEQHNPMAMISVVNGGELTASQLEEGFSQHFKWNWEWREKAHPNGTFQMRLPNRTKFEELSNLISSVLRGQMFRRLWTQESEAIGKLHVVWVNVKGLPDEMKGNFALFEVGSNLGVVMAVDMPMVRTQDSVRIKVGMLDLKVLPLRPTLTTPKCILYQAQFSLEEMVENGWLREQINTLQVVRRQEETAEATN